MQRDEKIRFSLKVVLAGLGLALLLNIFLSGFVLKAHYPQNTFLFRPWLVYSDFYEFVENGDMNPYLGGAPNGRPNFPEMPRLVSNYPPFPHLLAWGFALLSSDAGFVLYLLLCLGFVFLSSCRELRVPSQARTVLNAAGLGLASYPFLFLLQRGNMEIFNYIFVYFFAMSFNAGRTGIAALWLGAACAFKPFALPLFVLYLIRGRRKEGVIGLAATALLTFAALLPMHGSMADNLRALAANGAGYAKLYVVGPEGLSFGHTIYGLLRIIGGLFSGVYPGNASEAFMKWYMAGALCAGAALAWFALRAKQFWQSLFLLTAAGICLPYVSFDYRLLLLLVPFFHFINSPQAGPGDKTYCLLFSLLFIPKSYWYFWHSEITLNAALNPLLIAALCALIARDIIREGSAAHA